MTSSLNTNESNSIIILYPSSKSLEEASVGNNNFIPSTAAASTSFSAVKSDVIIQTLNENNKMGWLDWALFPSPSIPFPASLILYEDFHQANAKNNKKKIRDIWTSF